VPCEYKHRNLSVRVEDRSHAPGDLAIRFLYQGGQTDIVAVDVAQVRYGARTNAADLDGWISSTTRTCLRRKIRG
jgi:hypothetical protein